MKYFGIYISSRKEPIALVRKGRGILEYVDREGKWHDGIDLVGPYFFEGETGAIEVSAKEARKIFKKMKKSSAEKRSHTEKWSHTFKEAQSLLPQNHEEYFQIEFAGQVLPIQSLVPEHVDEEKISKANEWMNAARRGMLQKRKPILVKPNEDGTYLVLDGNSTYGAALQNGWDSLPVIFLT